MITTTFRGRGVGVATGWAVEGDEGDGPPEPQAKWKRSPVESRKTFLVVWGNPIILEMETSLESFENRTCASGVAGLYKKMGAGEAASNRQRVREADWSTVTARTETPWPESASI
jgi:hypothetical protein